MSGHRVHRIVKVVAGVGVVVVALGLLGRALVPRFMMCLPVSFRLNAQTGCWVLATKDLGVLPADKVYWRIDRFPSLASAEAERAPSGTVVESYGKVWLFTVTADHSGRAGGEPVAMIGPLPVTPGTTYVADYMEGTFSPGMRSMAHRHPGPEAFYNIEGEFCLETPGKKTVVGPAQSVFIEGETPMQLIATGTRIRRSLVLILRPAGRILGTPAFGWKPEGLCGAA